MSQGSQSSPLVWGSTQVSYKFT